MPVWWTRGAAAPLCRPQRLATDPCLPRALVFRACSIAVVTALVGFAQSMLVAALYKYRTDFLYNIVVRRTGPGASGVWESGPRSAPPPPPRSHGKAGRAADASSGSAAAALLVMVACFSQI